MHRAIFILAYLISHVNNTNMSHRSVTDASSFPWNVFILFARNETWPMNFQKQPPGSVLLKKMFLESWQNSQKNTCARVSFLIVAGWGLQLYYIKSRLLHKCFPAGFTNEFCEISKKTFSYRTTPAAAS